MKNRPTPRKKVVTFPSNWKNIYHAYMCRAMTGKECQDYLGLSAQQFYNLLNIYMALTGNIEAIYKK